ncbi:MAG: hypothetical protein JWP91_4274 [Fibrobacteres bacterium]|nr:hypothetical protein [Fibrobacterota bacterium]
MAREFRPGRDSRRLEGVPDASRRKKREFPEAVSRFQRRSAGTGPGPITNFQAMFDRIMENSMAIWMLVSAVFPIFFFGTIIKAVLHFRRRRGLLEYLPRIPVPQARFEQDDWVPSP